MTYALRFINELPLYPWIPTLALWQMRLFPFVLHTQITINNYCFLRQNRVPSTLFVPVQSKDLFWNTQRWLKLFVCPQERNWSDYNRPTIQMTISLPSSYDTSKATRNFFNHIILIIRFYSCLLFVLRNLPFLKKNRISKVKNVIVISNAWRIETKDFIKVGPFNNTLGRK